MGGMVDIVEQVKLQPTQELCGGRTGTLVMGSEDKDKASALQEAEQAFGAPDASHYGEMVTDGLGRVFMDEPKVTKEWHFITPRGAVEVSDYWWNQRNELSIRSQDWRATLWFCAAMRRRGYRASARHTALYRWGG